MTALGHERRHLVSLVSSGSSLVRGPRARVQVLSRAQASAPTATPGLPRQIKSDWSPLLAAD